MSALYLLERKPGFWLWLWLSRGYCVHGSSGDSRERSEEQSNYVSKRGSLLLLFFNVLDQDEHPDF